MEKEKAHVKAAQELLRAEEVSYLNDSLYGAAMLLDSYDNGDLSLEDALNEFLENTDLELKVKEK